MTTDTLPGSLPDKTLSKLVSYRRVAWALLLFGVLASLGGNILYAPANPIAQAISALPAISFLGTMWLLERIPWDWTTTTSYVARLALIAVAGISAWISYWHMVHVAGAYGQEASSAALLPGAVDGLILASSMATLRLGYLISQLEEEAPREAPALPTLPTLPPAQETLPSPIEMVRRESVARWEDAQEASSPAVMEETVTETQTRTVSRRVSGGGDLSELVSRLREGVEAGETKPTISAAKTYLSVGHSKAKDVVALLNQQEQESA